MLLPVGARRDVEPARMGCNWLDGKFMTIQQRRARVEIVLDMQRAGGQKTFVVGEAPGEVFRYLAGLEADCIVERVPSKDALALTYRLTGKDLNKWRGGPLDR